MKKLKKWFKQFLTKLKKINPKVTKTLLIITLVIVLFVGLVIAFISPITKYLIEKYDVKYIGREVKVGKVYLNPFTAYIHIGNIRMYELNSDSAFVTAKSLNVDFNLTKLIFKRTYEISSLKLDHPVFNIIQKRQVFNFNDLIDKFTPKEKNLVKKARTNFNILNIKIIEGRMNYRELSIPVQYFLKKMNIESTGMWWNRDTITVKFGLENGPSTGKVNGTMTVNLTKNLYRVNVQIKNYDLKFLEQYIHDMANYGNFAAVLDGVIQASGGFDILQTKAKGWVRIHDFHLGKSAGDDIVSLDKMMISFSEVNPKQFRYYMDSIVITHPFLVYEKYDYLDNVQRMFGKGFSKIKIAYADSTKFNVIILAAKQIEKIAANFLVSYYKINKVAVNNGNIKFNDFSPREKFSIGLNPFYFKADSIDKHHDRIYFRMYADLKPFGQISLKFNANPNNFNYFRADYNFHKIPISMMNPYLITYTSFPLDRGFLDFTGYMNVTDGNINSQNHLVIMDPRVGKRIKKKDTKWIPVPLAMAFLRENGNVIDYEIPVSGNLKHPKIHFKDIILDLLRNIFFKPPATPYRFRVKNVEHRIENALTLKWEMRQTLLRNGQERHLDKIAGFLKDTPGATILVQPLIYTEKEKEHILFYEAKKKYYLMQHGKNAASLTHDDSVQIDKMSPKDEKFIRYLDKYYDGNSMFTIQQKCERYIGSKLVNARFDQLLKERKQIFLQYFKDNGTENRVKFTGIKNTIPFNGFSVFKINYHGAVPKELTDAYEDLENLDEMFPRKKFLERRKDKKANQ